MAKKSAAALSGGACLGCLVVVDDRVGSGLLLDVDRPRCGPVFCAVAGRRTRMAGRPGTMGSVRTRNVGVLEYGTAGGVLSSSS